jgi:D-glycero-D-manno-heptose 1,7-bisphosphate phosphatase
MNKAIFLDRDGVINEVLSERVRYVNKPEDFYLLPGVADAIAIFRKLGYLIFVVTNQGGIGCGFMDEKSLQAIHQRMREALLEENEQAIIDDIRYCPHRPNAGCDCRKPHPKMIRELAKQYRVVLKQSYMVGDREPDIIAGKKAGCKTVFIGRDYPDLLQFAEELQKRSS